MTLVGLCLVAAFALSVGVGFVAALGGGVAIGGISIFAGLALIAAGLLGGPRWLILPAMVLVVPLAVVSAADLDLRGGVGQREYRPTSVADLRPEYRLGVGQIDLDLRNLELPAGPDRRRRSASGSARRACACPRTCAWRPTRRSASAPPTSPTASRTGPDIDIHESSEPTTAARASCS